MGAVLQTVEKTVLAVVFEQIWDEGSFRHFALVRRTGSQMREDRVDVLDTMRCE